VLSEWSDVGCFDLFLFFVKTFVGFGPIHQGGCFFVRGGGVTCSGFSHLPGGLCVLSNNWLSGITGITGITG